MRKRKLEDLNLIDDFLFGKILTHPVYGEEFGKILIRTIIGRDVNHLKVTAQSVYYGADVDAHGIRLDVYMDEAVEETDAKIGEEIFDIEPDNNRKDMDGLPKRMRFYHALIDYRALEAGRDYRLLRNCLDHHDSSL